MGKGRDKDLIEKRDEALFASWYYWTEEKRLRFDDALQKLSEEEFFLSTGRILQILRKQISLGRTVKGKTIKAPLFRGFKV